MRNPELLLVRVNTRREVLPKGVVRNVHFLFHFRFIFLFYLLVQTLGDDSTELDIRWKKYNKI